MSREKFEATDQSVSEAYELRQLVGLIFSYANYQNEDLREVCLRLHNKKIIDLLGLVGTKEFESVDLQAFFAGQKLYCDVIPKLEAPVAAMTSCVKALVDKAGNDLAANLPREAFKKWCAADLRRAREIIDGARDNEETAKEFLTIALIAGNYGQDAKEFIRGYVDTRRLSGVFALGRIKCDRLPDSIDALTLLHKTVSTHTDDILFANVLAASFDIASNSIQTDDELLLAIVTRICEIPGPAALDACAQVLLHHQRKLSRDLLTSLFGALKKLAVTQKGSLGTLDVALSQLLRDNSANEAIDFLKEYLVSNDEHLTLSEFESFESALKSNPTKLQSTLLSWMLTGEMVLCEGVAALFRNGEDKPFDFDVSISHLDTTQQIFICKKIIGYLFTQPLIACSFLVCVLRQCNDEVADSISKLLFDPMLRSYGGAISYLSSIQPDDKAYARIRPALHRADNYIAEINSIGEIKELHPSEGARQAVSLRDFDEMQEARKEAEKDSVLLNLVSRSVVLHGRRTLSYIQTPGQEREPMEMELHAHSFAFEMPRQNVLDPVGIEFVLRVFRAERFEA